MVFAALNVEILPRDVTMRAVSAEFDSSVEIKFPAEMPNESDHTSQKTSL